MFYDPIEQRLFETNVVTGLFTFDPLVTEDFLTLGEELLIKQGFSDEVVIICHRCCHALA